MYCASIHRVLTTPSVRPSFPPKRCIFLIFYSNFLISWSFTSQTCAPARLTKKPYSRIWKRNTPDTGYAWYWDTPVSKIRMIQGYTLSGHAWYQDTPDIRTRLISGYAWYQDTPVPGYAWYQDTPHTRIPLYRDTPDTRIRLIPEYAWYRDTPDTRMPLYRDTP